MKPTRPWAVRRLTPTVHARPVVAALLLWAACVPVSAYAQSQPPAQASASGAPPLAIKADPLEGLNRSVFAFNEALDRALLKPLATAYKAVLPGPVRTGVDNVFGNVGDAWSVVNHVLQGKFKSALEMTVRVTTNTVFGVGGLFDLASDAGLERQSEDFGQTLGKWGFSPGPYLVLPFFGASSLRDAAGLTLDRQASLPAVVHDGAYRWGLNTLELVYTRADVLSATNLLEQVALDKYSFVRDSYLARRRNLVFDGNPPEEPEEDEPLPAQAPSPSASASSSVYSPPSSPPSPTP